MADPIRVLLVDDHALLREGIRSVLEQVGTFDVVGEAGSGEEALRLAGELRPDVVTLDVSMPGQSGLDVAAELRKRHPDLRILILSVHENAEYVLQAVRAGAHGYLLKDSPPAVLREAIATVHAGREYFSPAVAGSLSAALRAPEPAQPDDRLTPRERQVLARIARGLTNKQAAAELGISHRTVETHRENVMRKLGLNSVADLTRYAIEHGIAD